MNKKRKPKVSIIFSAYNHAEFIEQLVNSILDQTYSNFEIIAVDNGSLDNTSEIIKSIKDPRIKLYKLKKNVGLSLGLNYGLERSKGEFICFVGSDDIFFPDKLEKQIKYLEEHPSVGAVFSYVQLINENGERLPDNSHDYHEIFNKTNRQRHEWLNYFFYKGNCLCFSTSCVHKSCFKDVRYFNPLLAQLQDFDTWVALTFRHDVHIIQKPLVKFRIRAENKNLSANTIETRVRSIFEFGHVLKRFLSIQKVDAFLKIFPEEGKKYKDIIDNELIPFYVARAALNVEHVFHQKFALDTLYDLLSDKKMVEKMEKICHFSYPEFIKITGDHDLYHVQHIDYQTNKINQLVNEREKFKSFSYQLKFLLKKIFLPYA